MGYLNWTQKMKIVLIWSLWLFFFQVPAVFPANPAPFANPIKIGVLAKRGAEKTIEKWRATADYLTQQIPHNQFVIVPLGFDALQTSLIKKDIDFVITNSGYYVMLEDQYGLSRIATLRNRWQNKGYQIFGGVVFTRADNIKINKFDDLKGSRFTAVDPNSFGGWLMARFEFHRKGIDTDDYFSDLIFAGTHDKVVMAVLNKTVDAGTVRTDTLERMAIEGKISLAEFKIIESKSKTSRFPFLRSTQLYPEWPFAKLSHTSNDLSEQVTISLLNMPSQSTAAIRAKITGWTVPLDYRPVHNLMKELKIGQYQALNNIGLMDIILQYWMWIITAIVFIAGIIGTLLYVTILNKKLKFAHLSVEKANEALEAKVKQRTQELAASEQKYRIVADNTYDWELWVDPKGCFIYCSPSCKAITGYDQSKFLENPELMKSLLHPEDLQRFEDHRNDEESHSSVEKFEFRIIDRSGEERWIEHVCKPIFYQDTYLGFRASNKDITEHRKFQLALQKSEETLQIIFNNAPAIMALLNENMEVIKMNQAGLIIAGEPTDKVVGLRPGDILNCVGSFQNSNGCGFGEKCKSCKMRQTVEETFATNNNFYKIKAEFKLKENNKVSEHIVLISTAIVNYKSPKIVLVTIDDITEIQRIETQLQQAQKMEAIGNLAGGIAHDFNNILSPILGFTEMLQEDLPQNSPEQASISQILKATLRAKDLVHQILAFSRQSDQELKPVKFQSILKEALKLLRSSIPKTIDIQTEIDSDCGVVVADPTQLHQIIMNLATNAYHAMQDSGGILKVSLIQTEIESRLVVFSELLPGKYALLKVIDTGIGIKNDMMSNIFDPYFTTKTKDKGTGLGLSVVQGIIRSCHGDIHIYSEYGKGTEIHVYLPIMKDASGKDRSEQLSQIIGGTERILLVDDEEPIIKIEKMMLERLGYHVTSISDSRTAFEMFKTNPDEFDLVITDMTMPNMTGVQLADEIKRIKTDIPIIICSGFSDQINQETFKEIGIHGYVPKPVTKREIARTIREVLDTSKK